MLIIGLTGGIGSGKSTVESIFIELGIPCIDADKIAAEVCEPGQPGFAAIVGHFSAEILNADGQLDRSKLRQRIFDNKTERQWLEATLHPMIRRAMFAKSQQFDTAYCVLSIPLLTETMNFDGIDRILVIDAPKELQIKRACKRDSINKAEADKILAAQNSREERLSYADDVIINDQSLEMLKKNVHHLHETYLNLSK